MCVCWAEVKLRQLSSFFAGRWKQFSFNASNGNGSRKWQEATTNGKPHAACGSLVNWKTTRASTERGPHAADQPARERLRESWPCGMQHAHPAHTRATVAAGAFVSHLETLPLSPTESPRVACGKWRILPCCTTCPLQHRTYCAHFRHSDWEIGYGLSQHSQYLINANPACGTHMIYGCNSALQCEFFPLHSLS